MSDLALEESAAPVEASHVDVLVVGAGISGIGAAYHLRTQRPGTRFVVLDALDHHGGTWWTHRYPGIRSDSDLFTFGYRFKPWTGTPIATAEEILRYLDEVIDENDLGRHIRYQHRVTSATWSSDEARWTVDVTRTDTGEQLRYTTGFLWMCQGYYRHSEGYTPEWPGMDTFEGRIVHPQQWPDDLDLSGKRVVVIGSGATAATLIPAIAGQCEHVTMLQRSPTFFFVRPNSNELADTLRQLDIPDEWTHEIVRRKILHDQAEITRLSFEAPELLRQFLIDTIRPLLPEGFDVDKHFNPSYRPWQQRIAVLPDGDLFTAVREGKAGVATDHIASFTPTGIALESGEHLDADVIVTATGFDLSVMGDVDFVVDDQKIDFADAVTYRGIMFTGVPNMAYVFGYFRASWTLRADLIADFVCRLLGHMDERGARTVVPVVPDDEAGMQLGPWVDPDNFNPGYLTRSMHLMPKQGPHDPWRLLHDYDVEKELLPSADLDDGRLRYS
jgi:monooxygenase